MSGDSLVFEMSNQTESVPSIFLKKDSLAILDNQNSNYQGGQVVIDTSQLSNSNKYMNYREAYLTMPLLLTLSATAGVAFAPATPATSADYALGLKNWYGSVIHSLTLDYMGTTIIQQTPLCGIWNSFKLMTTLSYQDILSQGAEIGFYPDNATAWSYSTAATPSGIGACNNDNSGLLPVVTGALANGDRSNEGFTKRQQYWNFDLAALTRAGTGLAYSTLISSAGMNNLWKSYIFNKINFTAGPTAGVFQVAITAIVKLKHLHSFFERMPLLKGVFFKLTLTLNQTSVSFSSAGAGGNLTLTAVDSPVGGVSPIQIASAAAGCGSVATFPAGAYIASLSVGAVCNNANQVSLAGGLIQQSPLGRSVLLNVPAYSFNPVYETAYLSSPIKTVNYEDIYQYSVINTIGAGGTFNQLITNGIANIKQILVVPYYSAASNGGIAPILSPYEGSGAGTTSPLVHFNNFNIQVSGQNLIYNSVRYEYEAFVNQLYGVNAVNAGETDGMTSGLIGLKEFSNEYCYYYANAGRMLPVEEAVPKSVNIIGTNQSLKAIDLYIFISYGVTVSIDSLTGARV